MDRLISSTPPESTKAAGLGIRSSVFYVPVMPILPRNLSGAKTYDKGHGKAWEEYARLTFVSRTKNIPGEKLRFLQYVDAETEDWWSAQRRHGAILLGATAKAHGLTTV